MVEEDLVFMTHLMTIFDNATCKMSYKRLQKDK